MKPRRPEESYGGQALVFVRDVLDVSGPKMPTCLAFIERYKDRLVPVPQVGQVVLHDNKPYGNIGIYVSKGLALFMSPHGNPVLLTFSRPYTDDSTYRGAMWWPEEDA